MITKDRIISQDRLDRIKQGSRRGTRGSLIAKTLDPHADRFDMMIATGIFQLPPGEHRDGIEERHVFYLELHLLRVRISTNTDIREFYRVVVGGERDGVGHELPTTRAAPPA